jgi:hypothetical protein
LFYSPAGAVVSMGCSFLSWLDVCATTIFFMEVTTKEKFTHLPVFCRYNYNIVDAGLAHMYLQVQFLLKYLYFNNGCSHRFGF